MIVLHGDLNSSTKFENVTNITEELLKNDATTRAAAGEIANLPDFFTTVSPSMWPVIYAYAIIFFVAAVGNLIEFWWVCQRLKQHSSAMNRLLLHLCIADIVVVFMVALVEVVWRINIGKFVQYCRAFGLYLSSMMLVCLSLDRFYVVVYPLRALDASHRIKLMIATAWICAAVCAAPQFVIFRVESHPYYPDFKQCNSMVSGWLAETTNTLLSLSFMYFIPIFIIMISYGSIVYKLAKSSSNPDNRFLRRSSLVVVDRAKTKALKLSIVIIIAFIICWTPYVVISTWCIVDSESVEHLHPYVREALFLMVIANSSINPLVYGIFSLKRH